MLQMILLKRKIFFLTECADFCAYQGALSYAIARYGETEQRREARKDAYSAALLIPSSG